MLGSEPSALPLGDSPELRITASQNLHGMPILSLNHKTTQFIIGTNSHLLYMAGEVGIEPTNAEIKTQCLTTWRLPRITNYCFAKSCMGCRSNPCTTKPHISIGTRASAIRAADSVTNAANTQAPEPVIATIVALSSRLSHSR